MSRRPWSWFALALLAAPATVAAQDSQYWNIQYGPVGQLLGGQVVGSSRDLSATYYNPGGLSLAESPEFLLSVQAFELESFTLRPVEGGDVLELDTSSFDQFPGFVAFTLPRRWTDERTRLAVSILTRQRLNSRVDQRFAGVPPGGDGRYGLETLFDQQMSETWGGLTLSRRLSGRLGLGGTLYGVNRSQRSRWEQSLQVDFAPDSGLAALVVDDFNYSHWRLLGKIGLAWEGSATRLGISVTTPSAGLFGGGAGSLTRSVVGVDFDDDGRADSYLLNGLDEEIDATYRSSWSIAGGAAWRHGPLQLHTSAEWFAPVDRYAVMTADSPLSSGEPVTLTQELDSVVNAGLGVEYRLGGDLPAAGEATRATVLYASFITDNSASPDFVRGEASTSNLDFVHVTGGAGFNIGGSRFSLGLSHASGSKTRNYRFGALPPEVPILGEDRLVENTYARWVIMLGYFFDAD